MDLIEDYPFTIRHLSDDDGGGFLIEYPDLPGCMSDGDSIEKAITNGRDAIQCWMAAANAAGRKIPKPGSLDQVSGKWVQRVPKSLHQRLTEQAQLEGVSLNTLVVSMIAESLGERTQEKPPTNV